jgi:hypothetical protein
MSRTTASALLRHVLVHAQMWIEPDEPAPPPATRPDLALLRVSTGRLVPGTGGAGEAEREKDEAVARYTDEEKRTRRAAVTQEGTVALYTY